MRPYRAINLDLSISYTPSWPRYNAIGWMMKVHKNALFKRGREKDLLCFLDYGLSYEWAIGNDPKFSTCTAILGSCHSFHGAVWILFLRIEYYKKCLSVVHFSSKGWFMILSSIRCWYGNCMCLACSYGFWRPVLIENGRVSIYVGLRFQCWIVKGSLLPGACH